MGQLIRQVLGGTWAVGPNPRWNIGHWMQLPVSKNPTRVQEFRPRIMSLMLTRPGGDGDSGRDGRALNMIDVVRGVVFVLIIATGFLAAWQFGAIATVVVLLWLATRWNRRHSARAPNH